MTSRPVSATGITAAWIGVGCSKPILPTTSSTAVPRPSESNGLSVVETGGCGMATECIDVQRYINRDDGGGKNELDRAREPRRGDRAENVMLDESAAVARRPRPPAQHSLVTRQRASPTAQFDQHAPQRRRQV